MHAFDRQTGVIFFAQITTSGISCWNTANKLSPQTHEILAQNNATMIYPSDLNVSGIVELVSVGYALFKATLFLILAYLKD